MATRPTAKGEQTRETILVHALGLATRIGIEGLTIGRLAEELGMSKSGLFAHFRSKEALQLEMLKLAGARMVDSVVKPALAAPRGEPRVRALFERWLAWERSPSLPGGCPFMAASFELDDRPGPVRDFVVQNLRDWLDTLTGPPASRCRKVTSAPTSTASSSRTTARASAWHSSTPPASCTIPGPASARRPRSTRWSGPPARPDSPARVTSPRSRPPPPAAAASRSEETRHDRRRVPGPAK